MRKITLALALTLISSGAQGFTFTSVGPNVYNSNAAAMDAVLGLTGLIIEDFEDTNLIEGLGVSWGASAPTSVLGATVSFSGSEWDGTLVLDNRLNNNILNPNC